MREDLRISKSSPRFLSTTSPYTARRNNQRPLRNSSRSDEPSFMSRLGAPPNSEGSSEQSSYDNQLVTTPIRSEQDLVRDNEKFHSTINGNWSLVGFPATNFYDWNTGRANDRATFEKNVEKLIRNHRQVDSYEWLKLAEQARQQNLPPVLEKAMLANCMESVMANIRDSRVEREASKKAEPIVQIVEKRGFSLNCALQNDHILELPSRKRFKLSETITLGECANWTSSKYKSDIRSFLYGLVDKLEKADPWMPAYAANRNPNSYVPIQQEFFDTLSGFLISGFGQEVDDYDMHIFVQKLARDVFTNKINAIRKGFNAKFGEGASLKEANCLKADLANGLEPSFLFAALEIPQSSHDEPVEEEEDDEFINVQV